MEFGTVYNENCISTLSKMPDDFIDMTITSPPYDDLRDYNGYHFPVEEVAHLLNRKWIGSEISEEYVEIAKKRLEPYLGSLEFSGGK